MTSPPKASDYAPYDKMPAFLEGYEDYQRNRFTNPYDGSCDVRAQAWDRGLEFRMRVQQFLREVEQFNAERK